MWLVGFGCNDKKVVEILGHRNAPQRYDLARAYKSLYGEELTHRLKSELHSSLEVGLCCGSLIRWSFRFLWSLSVTLLVWVMQKAVLLWMLEPVQRDVHLLRNAMRGLGTRDKALIDVICTRTPTQLQLIKQYYAQQYGRSVEQDIMSDTSGHYEKVLSSCLHRTMAFFPSVLPLVLENG